VRSRWGRPFSSGQVGVVPPDHHLPFGGKLSQKLIKNLPDVIQVPVKIQVLPVEVGDNRHLGRQIQEGGVAFVGLSHEIVVPA
jgi:hypothetical protein